MDDAIVGTATIYKIAELGRNDLATNRASTRGCFFVWGNRNGFHLFVTHYLV